MPERPTALTAVRLPAVLALVAIACGDARPPADAPASGPPAAAAAPGTAIHARTLAPDLAIGVADGERVYEFARLAGITRDGRGRIWAADFGAGEVRAFDGDGRHVLTIGRPGAGPGEFQGPCCPAFDARGRLWIRDGGNARYQVFRIDGDRAALDDVVRMAHADVNRIVPTTFDADGRVVDVGFRPDLAAGSPRSARLHLDPDGRVAHHTLVHASPDDSTGVHIVERATPDGPMRFFFHQPFGPRELVAHGPGGEYAYALSTHGSVTWFAADGSVLHALRASGTEGPRLSARERERAREAIEQDVRRSGIARGELPYGIPLHKPPLEALFFDAAGRLWVELAVADGDPRVADVYDRSGAPVERVVWPAGIDLATGFVAPDAAIGTARDTLGVQRIVRLR
jgi:hypothetical protein